MAISILDVEAVADKYLFTGGSYVDQSFSENVFVDTLIKRMMQKHRGGERLSATLRYGKMPRGAYSRGDTIDRFFQEMFTRADFNWKHYYVSGVVYDTDLQSIEGPHQLVDYVSGIEANMMESLAEQLSEDLYGDGTALGGKVFEGLEKLCDQTTASYGGISSADMADWKAVYHGGVGSISTNLKTIAKYIRMLPKKPTIILTSEEVFSHFWDLAYDKTSIYDNILKVNSGMGKSSKRLVDLGVDHVNLNTIPIIADKKMDELGLTDSLYVLNENHLRFMAHPRRWFNKINPKEGWRMYEDSFTWFCDYGVTMQMVTDRRNVHMKLAGLSA